MYRLYAWYYSASRNKSNYFLNFFLTFFEYGEVVQQDSQGRILKVSAKAEFFEEVLSENGNVYYNKTPNKKSRRLHFRVNFRDF